MNSLTEIKIIEYNPEEDAAELSLLVRSFFQEQGDIAKRNKKFTLKDALSSTKLDFVQKRNNITLIAKSNNKIVGFIRAKKNEGIWLLKEIYVMKNNQKNGIGSKLFEKIKEILKSKKESAFYLSIIPLNKNALTFFKSKGINRLNMIELEVRLDDKKFDCKNNIIINDTKFEY